MSSVLEFCDRKVLGLYFVYRTMNLNLSIPGSPVLNSYANI